MALAQKTEVLIYLAYEFGHSSLSCARISDEACVQCGHLCGKSGRLSLIEEVDKAAHMLDLFLDGAESYHLHQLSVSVVGISRRVLA